MGPFWFVSFRARRMLIGFQRPDFKQPGQYQLALYNLKQNQMIYDLITLKTHPEKWSYYNLRLSFTFSLGLLFGKSAIAQFLHTAVYT